MTERVTLITGASAGIGTELARVFASHGHRLALVARRADRLEALADEITAAGGAAPIVIPCDLAAARCRRQDRRRAGRGRRRGRVRRQQCRLRPVRQGGPARSRRSARHDRRQHPRADRSVAALFRSADPQSRRPSQCRLDRRLSAGPGHGGLLRLQGLCAVVHRGDAGRAGAAWRARDRALSRSGAVGIPGARRLQARVRFGRSQGFCPPTSRSRPIAG